MERNETTQSHGDIKNPEIHPKMDEQQEPTQREVHILEALDTVQDAQAARERIAQLEDDKYREGFAEKWRADLERQIAEIEEKISLEESYVNRPGNTLDSSVLLSSKNKVAILSGRLIYLKSRLENASSEVVNELGHSKVSARRTIEDLAWALEELYALDETKCETASAKRLGEVFTRDSAWAADIERSAAMESDVIRLMHEANMLLAIPEEFPSLGLKQLKEMIRAIDQTTVFSEEYKKAHTREDWRTVLNIAVQAGLKKAQRYMRESVKGDKKYVIKDL